MKKIFGQHFFDYLLLITGAVFFLISLRVLSNDKTSMFITIIIFSSYYILWGIFHHTKNKSLYLKNMLEYVLIAFLIIFVIKIILLI